LNRNENNRSNGDKEKMAKVPLSCIIPTMKGREAMLQKLLSTLPEDCEKIIVGDEDLLLAAKRNKGASQAKGEYLFFVDDDNYLKEGALQEMLNSFHQEIGVMGMTACYDDKKMVVADGGSLRNLLTGFTEGIGTNQKIYDFPYYSWDGVEDHTTYGVDEAANAFMIPRHVFEEAGGFDEENFPIDLDEADLCKRIKDMGYKIVYNPRAICYHKSQTYSHIPNFRRPLNAYFMGRNRQLYQRKHLNALSYCVYVAFFCPVFVGFYTASLIWRKNIQMIPPFLKGVFDGLRGCRTNKYQQKL